MTELTDDFSVAYNFSFIKFMPHCNCEANQPVIWHRLLRMLSVVWLQFVALGAPVYARIDEPATAAQKTALQKLSPEDVEATELAGDPIQSMLTTAPGNGATIGSLFEGARQ